MTKRKDKIIYGAPEKEAQRRYIAEKPIKKLLMFLGSGQQHEFMEKNYPKTEILSIDNDREVGVRIAKKNQRYIGLKELCDEGKEKFDGIHTDYMSEYGNPIMADMENLYKIMDNKGFLFITVQRKREKFLPKGMGRARIITTTIQEVQKIMARRGIILELETLSEYISHPEYKERNKDANWGCPMITYGFSWKKVKHKITSIILPPDIIPSIH